jgi:hypothetical protein
MTLRLMGRNNCLNLGWLAVWGLNPDWLGRKFNFGTIQRFGGASAPEGGMRAVSSSHFIETESPLPHSQVPATRPYHKAAHSNPYPHIQLPEIPP